VIKILDNFFDDKLFINIQNHITSSIFFTPRYFEGKERTIENYYGSRFKLSEDKNLLNTFVKQAENKFNIKIKKIGPDSGIDLRNTDRFRPHTDKGKFNILIMLKGLSAITNGTVFFTEEELDIQVGFKENRAIMFPSDKYHSANVNEVLNVRRYTATLFVEDYEE
tara:strand:- start:1199 stop:1696 length:498 start_codon:yes stop_codon:yes gene_type:complete